MKVPQENSFAMCETWTMGQNFATKSQRMTRGDTLF